MSEAFIYLWYDARNKKYYLGKHKGSLDDSYTHSSTIWKHFTKDNIPEGVSRRILAYGTDEEMCVLEHELLVNRKKRCWNRYYNNSLGDPRYVDTSGKNNPMYKHGKTVGARENPEIKAAYDKERGQWPEYRESERIRDRKRNATPERKAWRKAYHRTPEYRAINRARKNKVETQGVGNLEAFL